MRIKLIHIPRWSDFTNYLPPLGIATLKTLLQEKGHTVDLDDLDIKARYYNENCSNEEDKIKLALFSKKELINKYLKGSSSDLDEEAEKILSMTSIKGYDIIGLSLLDDSNFSVIGVAMILSKLIKEKTGAIVIVGGLTYPRPMVEMNEFLEKNYIDFIITMSGEAQMVSLLDAIENNELGNYKIKNLYTTNEKYKPKQNAKKQKFIYGLGDFIKPNFDGLPLDLYRYYPDNKTRKKDSVLMLPYLFVAGCVNKCTFCPISICDQFAAKEPMIVASELKELSKKYKTRNFFFINTNINPSLEYTNNLCNELEASDTDILWTDCANFKFLDKKLLEKLKNTGAVRIIYGIESPNEKILKYVNKGITVKKAEALLKKSHGIGIWNEVELIAGLPYETDGDINGTIKFMKKNGRHIDFFHLNRFILKNSLLYENPKKYGLTNIKPLVSTIFDVKDTSQNFVRGFDEINGLKWVEKEKQINNSFEKIDLARKEERKRKGYFYDSNSHMPLLFYLYSKFEKKVDIKNYFMERYKYTEDE